MNVLIIMDDALRPRSMGCYGYPKPTTPVIDRLAAEGACFKWCISVSAHTFPPVVSLMTGQFTATHGLMTERDYHRWMHEDLWKGRRTPLHALADAGRPAEGELVMRWRPLGFARDANDIFAFIRDNRHRPWFYLAEPYPTHLPYNPPQEYYELFVDEGFRPDAGTQERMRIVRTKMICHPPDVKAAMEVGEEDSIGKIDDDAHTRTSAIVSFEPQDEPGIRALYDGQVRVFDDYVGRVVRLLEEQGQLDDTVIVITADHGEEILERGHVGHTSCNLKGTLYDESIHVPLIIRYPPKVPAGAVVERQVSQVDLMPTLFELMGLPLGLPVDGASLVPLMRGQAASFREETYAEVPPAGWQALRGDRRRLYCVRTRDWKLIKKVEYPGGPGEYELYDLQGDPGERTNVIDRHPSKVAALKSSLERHFSPLVP